MLVDHELPEGSAELVRDEEDTSTLLEYMAVREKQLTVGAAVGSAGSGAIRANSLLETAADEVEALLFEFTKKLAHEVNDPELGTTYCAYILFMVSQEPSP